jgi:hypothetical protein
MERNETISREILEEDMQIMRFTLAAISHDVQRYSESSATALAEAAEKLEVAQREFTRSSMVTA